jgi:Domain of unknown function (DUF4145)
MKYESPESGKKSFTCPHCGVLARQYHFSNTPDFRNSNTFSKNDPIRTSVCEFCGFFCIWHYDELVYPNRGNAPAPNAELPLDVKKDYEEAASISNSSPRGAAALLRLAIQKLAKHLGGKGDNLNNDIELLLNNGLPVSVQKALDIVRVIGNNAVHPGQIDVDNPDVVSNLFSLVNVISEYMISMPNRISTLYEGLPEDSKKSITKRNSKS